jgi:hypothetical protein
LLLLAFKSFSDAVVDQCTENDQAQEPPVPPTIENITGSNNECVLQPKVTLGKKPIKNKNDGQKDCKVQRIKEHQRLYSLHHLVRSKNNKARSGAHYHFFGFGGMLLTIESESG